MAQREALDQIKQKSRTIESTGCREWQSVSGDRYGQMKYAGKLRKAHRVAFSLATGFDIDSPLCVLHHCDNRRCVNHAHLFVGTRADNQHDMVSKGRNRPPHLRGNANPAAKLYPTDVVEIRVMREHGAGEQETALMFGVSRSLVGQICRREIWEEIR